MYAEQAAMKERIDIIRHEIKQSQKRQVEMRSKIGGHYITKQSIHDRTLENEKDFEKLHQSLVGVTWLLHELSEIVFVNCTTLLRMSRDRVQYFEVCSAVFATIVSYLSYLRKRCVYSENRGNLWVHHLTCTLLFRILCCRWNRAPGMNDRAFLASI